MATKKKRKEMVFHKEWTNVSTKAARPPPPPPSFVLLKPMKDVVGDGTMFADQVEEHMKKPVAGGSSPTKVIPENLPAEIIRRGVSVTLDNNVMWNEFFRCQTEMILTQDGSRMFPYCRFRISGLDASKKYSLVVDIQPVDSHQYEWTGHNWQVTGKAMRHVKSRPFSHPDSPSTGQHWMEQPVSFYKLKLTNIVPSQGNLVLNPLHRYIPRLHVVPFSANTKKELKLNGPRVATFTFPQTEFFAVTAYQNLRFIQRKVNYNPFAKGFKDDSLLALKLKPAAGKELNHEANPPNNQNPLVKKSFKSLLTNHKPRSSTTADHKHADTLIPASTISTEEPSSKTKPSQKLFSELIREAHVSLRRCNLDKMVASMKSTGQVKEAVTEPPAPTVCTTVNESSTTASSPAPKLPLKPFLSLLDCNSNTEPQPEENLRPHRRPALVPLPALARFLSKHQSKHRNVVARPEPLHTPPSEATPLPKAAPGVRSPEGSHSSYCISPPSSPHHQEPTQEGQVLAPPIVVPNPKEPDGIPVLPSTDLPLSTSERIHFSTLTPASEVLPTAMDTFLAGITDSSTVSRRLSTNKPAPLLPESSPIGLEHLSHTFSPEPSPPLPVSLGLETTPPPSVVHTTLKWHSLFPQPDPFLTSFTPFYATPQSTLNPPVQPCQDAPSETTDPLLHEDEYQSLPFPGELSPLALQLSLSPSFSSLDGGALSPTPSLSDLLSFISTDNNNLLLEAEVGKAEHVPVPCPSLPLVVPTTRPDPSPQVPSEPEPATKPLKGKKKCRKGQSKGASRDCDPVYAKMQPSLEEVEEQLFVSFTSKEALKLHLQDSLEGPETQPLESSREDPQPTAPSPEGASPPPSTPPPATGGIAASASVDSVSPGKGLEESVVAFQNILLRDLKLMKNRQVIHPVLQEVGLKMHLLDSALAVDLQYLGVRLPIPPHPVSLEALAPPPQAPSPPPPHLQPQSLCLDFVSRTGKTSDITQIKGWRDKFSPSESSTSSSSSRPEAAASSEPPSKNLSAFCSDMLDEYLENEGKFLDQQASSFSQAPPEPVAYELPTQSSSYVRTLSSVLKKQPLSAPTSALISSFVPPSKRPRLLPTSTKKSKADRKQKTAGSKLKSKPASVTGDSAPTNSSSALGSPTAAGPEEPLTQRPTLTSSPAQAGTLSTHPTLTSQTLAVSASKVPASAGQDPEPGCLDLAPLESDSELGPAGDEALSLPPQPKALVSVTLLKQRDLEEGVVWQGHPRTCITEERASIALTSLFTTAGFVREDPTAPIQQVKRRAPVCLNEFCRLGCVCSSLAHTRPITHCGKVQCMLGCSCLRQKVVLLKNLDGSDSSLSELDPSKRKRKKRMKMAYVLKETESVAQPAQPVRTLWKGGDVDPEPMYTPETVPLRRNQVRRVAWSNAKTCARVRGYMGRKTVEHTLRSEGVKEAEGPTKETRCRTTASTTASPPSKLPEFRTKLSKHLVIVADCRWPSPEVQTQVLKAVCQAMAQERLHKPFWINKYYAKLLNFSIKNGVINYKVHISEGKADLPKAPVSTSRPDQIGPSKTGPTGPGGEEVQGEEAVEDCQKEVEEEGAVEDWQKEVKEEAVEDWQKEVEEEAVEDWQKEVEEAEAVEDCQKQVEEAEAVEDCQKQVEEAEAVEDWQKEVEEAEAVEDCQKQVEEDNLEEDTKDLKKGGRKRMMKMGLPFRSGLCQAGFLSASRKEPGGDNLLVQVNGKAYPMAMVQLGRMGALHPANRLAAYLTGRVGPPRRPGPPASNATTVTMATTPQTADQKSPGAGFPGVQLKTRQLYLCNANGQLSQGTDRGMIRLVPLSQIMGPTVPDGTPRSRKIGKKIIASRAPKPLKMARTASEAPPPARPAPSTEPCKLRLVSANHSSSMPLIITVPMLCPPTPAGSSETEQNITPAGSSGTEQNITPAGSGGTEQNITPAGSGGTEQNITPAGSSGTEQIITLAGSSGTEQNITPAGSSGTELNIRELASSGPDLNIICVDNKPDLLSIEEHVGVARTSEEKPSLVGLQRAERDAAAVLSSDPSDSSSDSEPEKGPRSWHTLLERQRRKAISVGLSRLKREIGLGDKTPKAVILKQAHEEVLELRSSESSLAQLKGSLKRQREERIRALARRTGKTEDSIARDLLHLSSWNPQEERTGSNPPLAAEVMVQLDETDEQTENSSDEENLPSGAHYNITTAFHDGDVDIETLEENSSLAVDYRRCLVTAFRSLRSELNSETRTRQQLLDQAYSIILDLKQEEKHCEKVLVALKSQRSKLLNNISTRSGRSKKQILEKLQSITARQRQLEEMQSKPRPAEDSPPLNLPAARTPSKAPLAPQAAPPRSPPAVPQHAVRLRTVPNILARRKLPPPPPAPLAVQSQSSEAAAPPVHTALMPPELVSFVCPLPGQQVITLKRMASQPGVLPPNPGVASVSLDISYPANERLPHPCLPHPSSSTGPFPTLLYLAPPPTALQPRQQLQDQATHLPPHQSIPTGSLLLNQSLFAGSLPSHQSISAGSLLLNQTLFAGSLPPHQTVPAGSLPQQTALSGVTELPSSGPEEAAGPSLLDLSFLHQNHGRPADRTALSSAPGPTCSSSGREVGGGGFGAGEPHNDGPLEPPRSNEDLTEATRVNGHMQSADGPEPNGHNALHSPPCSSKGGPLTLPPLLQMKVGGAKVSESISERAVGAWKPMPRLAAMGVKGGHPI